MCLYTINRAAWKGKEGKSDNNKKYLDRRTASIRAKEEQKYKKSFSNILNLPQNEKKGKKANHRYVT